MCCFSGSVRSVTNTRIFARLSGRGTQFLVYQMQYSADRDLAMILPLPVQTPAHETSVRFISLEQYPDFFADMESTDYGPPTGGVGGPTLTAAAGAIPSLVVHSVGKYSASFVPTLRDFGRLDKRFVLSPQVWAKLPNYRDFGFAVFKLKRTTTNTEIHPMAFEFRTRFRDRVFLPTVHIHDGQVHPTDEFDHALYVQDARLTPTDGRDSWGTLHPTNPNDRLDSSYRHAARFMNIPAARKIVHAHLPVLKRPLCGTHANRDTYIGLS